MKTIKQVCRVRASVFDENKRDDTLDLSNLIDGSLDPKHFFEETFITDGMKQLFDTSFKRFNGQASSGVIKLTQAMGGGKTHNMVALGLLARDEKLRKSVLNGEYSKDVEGNINVVAYTGRESDLNYGIWGEIARQLGKESLFKDYYSPLKAPGQSAWVNLLKSNTPTLILLDELPPYLQYTTTISSGTGTLADITVNALGNLFNAVNKAELHNVCIVISDLQATYEGGSRLLQQSFKDLQGEVERSSINIEPVGANTDDLYNILKTRLFEKIATKDEIAEVAVGFRKAVKEAKEMKYTDISPEEIVKGILSSYPFHPSVRDLFARFKENPGFQQTRGFIRLARIMVKNLWAEGGMADKRYLINAFDVDLNDSESMTTVKNIKPELSNAISRDIANHGMAAAEIIDGNRNNSDIQDLSKLVLMSSLGVVSGAINGLSINEIIGYMAEPGRDITNFTNSLDDFRTKAWYLYTDKDNRLLFRRVQNVNAELVEATKTYSYPIAKEKIKVVLQEHFKPNLADCYQQVYVFPSIEEIELKRNKITLILTEPSVGSKGLHSDVTKFYEDTTMKNRVMFLTGQRVTMDKLIENTKEYMAIEAIVNRMINTDKLQSNDTQLVQGKDLFDMISNRLYSNIRETFITLYFPKKDGLTSADFKMEFKGNNYDFEEQIKKVLLEVMKFTKDVEPTAFRDVFEKRIFTVRRMKWSDILERVATTVSWQWHHPNALEELKADSLRRGLWIDDKSGYLDKEPPAPETSVSYRVITRNDETGEVTLKLIPHNGDVIHYEIVDEATTGSLEIADIHNFKTNELKLSFICVDSKGKNTTGPAMFWENEISLKHRIFDKNGSQWVELKASSPKVVIKYSTNGSNPKENGGVYDDSFEIPKDSKYIQAIAYHEKTGVSSELRTFEVKEQRFELDREKPVKLIEPLKSTNTLESFKLLDSIKSYNTKVSGVGINIHQKGGKNGWLSLDMGDFEIDDIEKLINELNGLIEGFFTDKKYEINITMNNIEFQTGKIFEQWIAEQKLTLEEFKNKINQ